MKKFYFNLSFFMFFIGGSLGLGLSIVAAVTAFVHIDTPIIVYVMCGVLLTIAVLGFWWKEHPPFKTTIWLIKKLGLDALEAKYLEHTLKKNKWKYRIGQILTTGKYHVRISDYDDPYDTTRVQNKWYGGVIVGPKNSTLIGCRDAYKEGWLAPLYKFDTDDKNQLFGFIQNELRANGVLKTKT